ncbi:MAG: hypothetical protein ACPGSP_03350, partial [Alphaproteobacteria bacterium]
RPEIDETDACWQSRQQRCARREEFLRFTKSKLRRKTEAKPTDRAAGELRDALAKTAKRSRQGRRNLAAT